MIVVTKCSATIKSLLEEDGGYDSWLDAGYVFFDDAQALTYPAREPRDIEPGGSPDHAS